MGQSPLSEMISPFFIPYVSLLNATFNYTHSFNIQESFKCVLQINLLDSLHITEYAKKKK